MPFRFSDAHVAEYHTQGFTVFRQVVPPSLVADLRQVCDRGRELARERSGPQAQRLQPIARFDLDLAPFEAFRALPDLNDALRRIISHEVTFADVEQMGVLIEPVEHPWCTPWHRDWRDNAPYLDVSAWQAVLLDRNYFNQSNCALYEDHSLWVVPGSHLREDLSCEAGLFPVRPIPGPALEGQSSVERERLSAEYVRQMPGAVQLHLEAGDFALYRNSLWHLGNYLPYCKRATLHDFIDTPAYAAWRARMSQDFTRRKEAGHAAWEWNTALGQ